MTTNQPIDLALVGAYLHNLQLALAIDQPQHAELLLAHALQLMAPALTGQPPALLPTDLAIQFSAGVGLDPGKKRWGRPNEDCVFVAQGTIAATQEPFGLFVVADGVGGHGNGQEASRLAIETIVDSVLPQMRERQRDATSWGELLRHGVDEQQLADVLSSSWTSAGGMAERLVQLALAAGGLDNIGLVVVQVRIEDISGLQTVITPREGILLPV